MVTLLLRTVCCIRRHLDLQPDPPSHSLAARPPYFVNLASHHVPYLNLTPRATVTPCWMTAFHMGRTAPIEICNILPNWVVGFSIRVSRKKAHMAMRTPMVGSTYALLPMKMIGCTSAKLTAWYGILSSIGARECDNVNAWESDRNNRFNTSDADARDAHWGHTHALGGGRAAPPPIESDSILT